jgi:hypothetical protein
MASGTASPSCPGRHARADFRYTVVTTPIYAAGMFTPILAEVERLYRALDHTSGGAEQRARIAEDVMQPAGNGKASWESITRIAVVATVLLLSLFGGRDLKAAEIMVGVFGPGGGLACETNQPQPLPGFIGFNIPCTANNGTTLSVEETSDSSNSPPGDFGNASANASVLSNGNLFSFMGTASYSSSVTSCCLEASAAFNYANTLNLAAVPASNGTISSPGVSVTPLSGGNEQVNIAFAYQLTGTALPPNDQSRTNGGIIDVGLGTATTGQFIDTDISAASPTQPVSTFINVGLGAASSSPAPGLLLDQFTVPASTTSVTLSVQAEAEAAGSTPSTVTLDLNHTPPPTVQQLATLAGDAYSATPQGGAGYTVLQSTTGAFGFGATAYVEGDPQNGGQIVIAARGTSSVDDNSQAYSVLADTSYVTGSPNFALQSETLQFANFVSQIAAANPNAQITLTGYSLGGGIAQIVGSYADVQTVTFLSPGSAQFLPAFSNSLGFLQAQNIPTPATVIADYRQVGDLVSLVGTQVGTQITLENPMLQGVSGNALEAAIYGNFLGPQSFHSLETLSTLLANQPAVPGILGSGEQAGTPPDAFVTQTIHFAVVNGALSSFVVPGILANTLDGFDPGPGSSYSLVEAPGSPEFASAVLPIGDGADGWTLTYFTDSGQSGAETSSTGVFDFGPGVDQLDFFPIDASGDPVFYSDPFILGLSFDGSGTFDGTLTTSAPPGSVPEPSAIALFAAALAGIGLARCRNNGSRAAAGEI